MAVLIVAMQPRITFITLGVDDLERAVQFYGMVSAWPPRGSSARSSSTDRWRSSISSRV
jgi:predicted enzyme related to lactoylglutathione lyase